MRKSIKLILDDWTDSLRRIQKYEEIKYDGKSNKIH